MGRGITSHNGLLQSRFLWGLIPAHRVHDVLLVVLEDLVVHLQQGGAQVLQNLGLAAMLKLQVSMGS